MGAANLEAETDARLDTVFGALAHRTRRAMLQALCEGPAAVTQLAAPHDMTLPAASKHVRVLERAGLVRREVNGRVHRCSLEAGPLRDVEQWVEHYREFWSDALEALARYVEDDA